MTCHCKICDRHRTLERILPLLPLIYQEFVRKLEEDLLYAEEDALYYKLKYYELKP